MFSVETNELIGGHVMRTKLKRLSMYSSSKRVEFNL